MLSGGRTGFCALARAVEGISDSMLSDRLSELSNAGLVTRSVTEEPPLSVTYALTDAGPSRSGAFSGGFLLDLATDLVIEAAGG